MTCQFMFSRKRTLKAVRTVQAQVSWASNQALCHVILEYLHAPVMQETARNALATAAAAAPSNRSGGIVRREPPPPEQPLAPAHNAGSPSTRETAGSESQRGHTPANKRLPQPDLSSGSSQATANMCPGD